MTEYKDYFKEEPQGFQVRMPCRICENRNGECQHPPCSHCVHNPCGEGYDPEAWKAVKEGIE